MGEEGGGGSLNDPDVMNDGLLLLNIHRLRDLLPTFFAAYTKKKSCRISLAAFFISHASGVSVSGDGNAVLAVCRSVRPPLWSRL